MGNGRVRLNPWLFPDSFCSWWHASPRLTIHTSVLCWSRPIPALSRFRKRGSDGLFRWRNCRCTASTVKLHVATWKDALTDAYGADLSSRSTSKGRTFTSPLPLVLRGIHRGSYSDTASAQSWFAVLRMKTVVESGMERFLHRAATSHTSLALVSRWRARRSLPSGLWICKSSEWRECA
jgi:hypothetical protein